MTLTEALPSAATKNQSSVLGDVHAAISDPAPAPQSPQKDASPPAASVKSGEENNQPTREAKGTNSLNVSAEKTNYARYLRLLMDVGKEVLLSIFKASYKKQEKKLWTDSSGPTFLDNRFSGPSQRQLGKHLIDNIRTVTCEKWDITLLSSLLLFTPGYIKDRHSAKIAVEKLRDQRNALAHSADFLATQSLADKEFQEKWEVVARELRVLAEQLLPEEKAMWDSKIDEIATENFHESSFEPLFERVQEDIKHLQDIAEDARDMAVEALKRTEKAVSISQVNKALDARLQSLLNPYGQIDQKSLPRDVTLSNDRKYRLIKQVGKGGMGTVFRGKIIDDPNGGSVAIKISHTDASQERAQREADILKRLSSVNHDNIVKFLDSALDGSCLVIVMELINGKPLDDWLDFRYSDGNPGVSFLDTAPIVKQLAEGMAVVHSHKIAHRDIKPGNLIFDEVTTKLVIVDFGLSKQHYANSTMTSANDQLGTLLYMSPEQLDGDISAVSFPSDVWSIGIVWHEMLTNYTPFEPSDRGGERRSSNSR